MLQGKQFDSSTTTVKADMIVCHARFGDHAVAAVEYWNHRTEIDLPDVYQDTSR